jgi:hypothetical protein
MFINFAQGRRLDPPRVGLTAVGPKGDRRITA